MLSTFEKITNAVEAQTSRFSINKIDEQVKRVRCATAPLPACTNGFSKTMGLPCAHRNFQFISKELSY
ncbi:hypothetical protein TRVA0_003S02080 [Trichomonascus vanleenenianus]|uniref:uncharacterized protein n=1 Tax=Trichomonascus vanleenenianus TaxID=2268995 RepID=UPI003ECA358B